jgi:hypothetical protein
MMGLPSESKTTDLVIKRGSRPKAAIFIAAGEVGLGGKNTVCFMAQRQKNVRGKTIKANQRCGDVIAKSKASPVHLPERSPSS